MQGSLEFKNSNTTVGLYLGQIRGAPVKSVSETCAGLRAVRLLPQPSTQYPKPQTRNPQRRETALMLEELPHSHLSTLLAPPANLRCQTGTNLCVFFERKKGTSRIATFPETTIFLIGIQ